jgi:hypothetical protein
MLGVARIFQDASPPTLPLEGLLRVWFCCFIRSRRLFGRPLLGEANVSRNENQSRYS